MITRAVLRGAAAGESSAHVAGIPVLLRQLLSLQDAGIVEVVLGEGLVAPVDPRLRIRIVASASPEATGNAPPSLIARPGLVWHPGLPKRLVCGSVSVDLERAALRPGEFVVPAGTPAERRAAEQLLFTTLIKPLDGIVSRTINRRLSFRVTRLLLETAVTPNQMTLFAGVFGLAGVGVVLALGAPGLFLGGVLVQIQSVLDGCDGELSRLKYLRSRRGEWLDQVFDDVVNLGLFAAAGWTVFRSGSALAGWLTLAGTVAHLIYQASTYIALLTRGGGSGSVTSLRWWGQPPARPADEPQPPVGIVSLLIHRDVLILLYPVSALFGATIIALLWSAVFFVVEGAICGLQWLVAGGPQKA